MFVLSPQLLPFFVMEVFEGLPGLPGLFVACMISGALKCVGFVCLFGFFRPTREFFTHLETSP